MAKSDNTEYVSDDNTNTETINNSSTNLNEEPELSMDFLRQSLDITYKKDVKENTEDNLDKRDSEEKESENKKNNYEERNYKQESNKKENNKSAESHKNKNIKKEENNVNTHNKQNNENDNQNQNKENIVPLERENVVQSEKENEERLGKTQVIRNELDLENAEYVKVEQKPVVETRKEKKYVGYSTRFIGALISFLILILIGTLSWLNAFNYEEEASINYEEKSKLDYKVYLKPNEYYETEYLEKNLLYVASLIDRIKVDFTYLLSIDEATDIDFNYGIYAQLVIADESGNNNYFEKEYTLQEDKKIKMRNAISQSIVEEISIDYDYYNDLANNFRSSYGLETTSYLKVFLKINKVNGENTKFTLNDSNDLSITIPLSSRAINIKMDYKEINSKNNVVKEAEVNVKSYLLIVLSVISYIVAIVALIYIIRLLLLLRPRNSAYDKYIKKILTEYDRLVVETPTYPDTKKSNIIKIRKFEELLDVRDNLKLPIMYYNLVKHHKAYFYIKHYKDLYLLKVKASDIEKEAKKDK